MSRCRAPVGSPLSVLYLHGFNSSPLSFKAQQLIRHWQQAGLPAERLHVPALPNHPHAAITLLERWLAQQAAVLLVGSSLGGYYATWLAQRYKSTQVLLINPAVRPHARFQQYLGPQQNFYTGERWVLTPEHVQALAALETPPVQDAVRYRVWLEAGDETLDYRDAAQFYRGCQLDIRDGGHHGYQGFVERIPELLALAGYA